MGETVDVERHMSDTMDGIPGAAIVDKAVWERQLEHLYLRVTLFCLSLFRLTLFPITLFPITLLGELQPVRGSECQPVAVAVDDDDLAGSEFVEQDPLGQRVFDLALDGPAQWPGAEHGVVALVGEELLGVVG